MSIVWLCSVSHYKFPSNKIVRDKTDSEKTCSFDIDNPIFSLHRSFTFTYTQLDEQNDLRHTTTLSLSYLINDAAPEKQRFTNTIATNPILKRTDIQ